MKVTVELNETPGRGCSPEEHLRLVKGVIARLYSREGSVPTALTRLADAIEAELPPEEPKQFGAIVVDRHGYYWFRWTSASGGACWLRRGEVPNIGRAKIWAEIEAKTIHAPGIAL